MRKWFRSNARGSKLCAKSTRPFSSDGRISICKTWDTPRIQPVAKSGSYVFDAQPLDLRGERYTGGMCMTLALAPDDAAQVNDLQARLVDVFR